MNLEELKSKLETNRLSQHFEKLVPFLRNTIRLYHKPTNESNIAIGQTKIGGRPDLPPEITWVTETTNVEKKRRKFVFFSEKITETITRPLSFIAQVNLSEAASFDQEDLLPKTGLLYFFYSAEQEAWGFDYQDKTKFKVIYWDGDFSRLTRIEFPDNLPDDARYKPCYVEMKTEISLPFYGHDAYEGFDGVEGDSFWDEVFVDGNLNKLLGYSDNIQNEMELECELVTNGLYCGDGSAYNDPKAKMLEPNAKNWRLLLQIDSNEECGMMWGDVGRLYFWIKKDDLQNGNFDQSWFCLQCS